MQEAFLFFNKVENISLNAHPFGNYTLVSVSLMLLFLISELSVCGIYSVPPLRYIWNTEMHTTKYNQPQQLSSEISIKIWPVCSQHSLFLSV